MIDDSRVGLVRQGVVAAVQRHDSPAIFDWLQKHGKIEDAYDPGGVEQFKNLPIIAVTAKAMKGDGRKCLDAGASDYIAKPVNVEQLTSLLRVWLNQ